MNDHDCRGKDIVRHHPPPNVEFRKKALVALLLVGFVPTFSILFSLKLSDNELHSQAFFIACKAWIFILPTYWFLRIEGNDISQSLPSREGLRMGAATGLGMTAIIVAMWLFLGDSIDSEAMIVQLEETGLTDIRLYIAGTIYWIFLNSLLEEYLFRWFITTKGLELLGSEKGAILLSSILFTIHHTLALHFFGFEIWQTVVASFGLLSAAAIWSWLYIRYRSIWVCWVSHAICDVAVFAIGYQIIFT